MAGKYLLALDQGTTSSRAIIAGRVRRVRSRPSLAPARRIPPPSDFIADSRRGGFVAGYGSSPRVRLGAKSANRRNPACSARHRPVPHLVFTSAPYVGRYLSREESPEGEPLRRDATSGESRRFFDGPTCRKASRATRGKPKAERGRLARGHVGGLPSKTSERARRRCVPEHAFTEKSINTSAVLPRCYTAGVIIAIIRTMLKIDVISVQP